MSTDEKQKEVINLAVSINKRGEILMIRRVKEEIGKGDAKLTWAFPGGRQRNSETPEQCVRRETIDETGYDVNPLVRISSREHPQFDVFVIYHLCPLASQEPVGKPNQPHEIAEIRWVKPETVEKLVTTDLNPSIKQLLELLKKGSEDTLFSKFTPDSSKTP
ncbi:MAG: NUDIX hydrolase [Candidatus Liptonbacteria bacterium]|nr:NUDIX hydrolase [Candidatus Liptonbacteria bacterium]